jgi:threonine/homoserine/homoserine lactone efflux protein
MKEIDINEQALINGGHDGAAYHAGVLVGDLLEVALTVFGGGRLLKMIK